MLGATFKCRGLAYLSEGLCKVKFPTTLIIKNGVAFLKTIRLFDVNFDALTMAETVALVETKINERKGVHLLGVNADKINELDANPEMKRIVSEAEIINADGASVVLASKVLGKSLPERVAGIDLMQELLSLANNNGYPVYFLGAKQEVVTMMVGRLEQQYPDLKIAGYRNGYFSRDKWEEIAVSLQEVQPSIVFIGITSPTKEYLIDFLMRKNINSIFMGVGGSFDVLSGNIMRAPIWVQKANLEWLYRVMQEPRRLFKRYFFGNAKFLGKIMKEKLSKNEKA